MDPHSENTKRRRGERLVLTDSDVEIFRLIQEHRFLRREHLHRLTGRPLKRLHRRLFDLEKKGYLSVPFRSPREKHIYSLTRSAVSILAERGIVPEELVDRRIRTRELTQLFLEHELMIVDFHVMLTLASKTGPLRLVEWREGHSLYDSVFVGGEKMAVRPDAFFKLEDSRRPTEANRFSFVLEADRSTESHPRFAPKLVADWNYIEQGLHVEKYKIKTAFRVLSITRTDARAENLCGLTSGMLPDRARKFFFFTSLKQISLADPTCVFGQVWLSPRAPGSHSLVAAPKGLAE